MRSYRGWLLICSISSLDMGSLLVNILFIFLNYQRDLPPMSTLDGPFRERSTDSSSNGSIITGCLWGKEE